MIRNLTVIGILLFITNTAGQNYVDIGKDWFMATNKPLCTWGNGGRFQGFVKANELPGAMTITSFNFLASENTTNQSFSNFKIYVGYSERTSLGTNFKENYSGNNPQLVYSIETMTTSTSKNEWFGWEFDTPFNYNGKDNLVFELRYDNPKGNISLSVSNGSNRCLFKNSPDSPTGDYLGNDNAMRLYYEPNTGMKKTKNAPASGIKLKVTDTNISVIFPSILNHRNIIASFYTSAGKLVYTEKSSIRNNRMKCNITELPTGLYTFIADCKDVQFIQKLCITH